MMSDASEMLAAALEQMDGIIAGIPSKPELLYKWAERAMGLLPSGRR